MALNLKVTKYAQYTLDDNLTDIEICRKIGCTIEELAFWKIEHDLMERYSKLRPDKYPWVPYHKRSRKNMPKAYHKKPKKDDPEGFYYC